MDSYERDEKASKIKKNIESFEDYFSENYKRYEKWMNFIHKSSITQDEKDALSTLGRPILEFPIIPHYISMLCGRFQKYEPAVFLRLKQESKNDADGNIDNRLQNLETVQNHLNYVLSDGAKKNSFKYEVFKNEVSGGFAVAEIYYDYEDEKSFDFKIKVKPVQDSTSCGFDPLAESSHKSDGRFCYRKYILSEDQFKRTYPKSDVVFKTAYNKNGIDWCQYSNGGEKYYCVIKYWEKEYKEEMLYLLSNGQSMLKKDYKKMLIEYEEMGVIAQPPQVLDKRKTGIVNIVQYDIYNECILDSNPTLYSQLPLIFFPGENYLIKSNGSLKQHCKPYGYNAEGVQKLKNVAGQSLANELESMIQSKFMIPERGIPDNESYIEAYINPQIASNIIYKDLDMQAPQGAERIAPPTPVPRQPIPPHVTQTFQMADEMTQNIMGTFRQQQTAQSNPMSGVALAITNVSNDSASSPYITNFVNSLIQVCRVIVDLIPKVYKKSQLIPTLDSKNQKSYVSMGDINYKPEEVDVDIDAGASASMQREINLQTLTSLMKASPLFNEFMNEKGIDVLIDNIDIPGIDALKSEVDEFIQQRKAQQQQMQQQQMQQQQMMMKIEMAKAQKELQAPAATEVQMKKVESDSMMNMIKEKNRETEEMASIDIANKQADTSLLKVMSDIKSDDTDAQLKRAEIDAEENRTEVEALKELTKMQESELNDKIDQYKDI